MQIVMPVSQNTVMRVRHTQFIIIFLKGHLGLPWEDYQTRRDRWASVHGGCLCFGWNIFCFIYIKRDWADHRCYVEALSCALGTDVSHWMCLKKGQHGSRSTLTRWPFKKYFFLWIAVVNHKLSFGYYQVCYHYHPPPFPVPARFLPSQPVHQSISRFNSLSLQSSVYFAQLLQDWLKVLKLLEVGSVGVCVREDGDGYVSG